MLTADGASLRIVVSGEERARVVRVYRGIAIGATAVAAWAALWFGGALLGGVLGVDPLGLGTPAMLALGGVGLLCVALIAAVAAWAWRVGRQMGARFPIGSTVLAVGAHAVEGPGTGPIAFERLAGAAVRSHAVRLPPPVSTGAVLGQRIGRGTGRSAGLDAHRTVELRPIDGPPIACHAAPCVDDAGFARVVDALAWETRRRGLPLETIG